MLSYFPSSFQIFDAIKLKHVTTTASIWFPVDSVTDLVVNRTFATDWIFECATIKLVESIQWFSSVETTRWNSILSGFFPVYSSASFGGFYHIFWKGNTMSHRRQESILSRLRNWSVVGQIGLFSALFWHEFISIFFPYFIGGFFHAEIS